MQWRNSKEKERLKENGGQMKIGGAKVMREVKNGRRLTDHNLKVVSYKV